MPLTEGEKKEKENMEREYGKEKGDQVFYAKENKNKKKHGLRRRRNRS